MPLSPAGIGPAGGRVFRGRMGTAAGVRSAVPFSGVFVLRAEIAAGAHGKPCRRGARVLPEEVDPAWDDLA